MKRASGNWFLACIVAAALSLPSCSKGEFKLITLDVAADACFVDCQGSGEDEVRGDLWTPAADSLDSICADSACGDKSCRTECGETGLVCPEDCCGPKFCGDGVCDPFCSEGSPGPKFCAFDCCVCGDGVCLKDECMEGWEDGLMTCAHDCAICGNELCDPGEGPAGCPLDCCGYCGDGICKGGECLEGPQTCPVDCEKFWCDNGTCEPTENPVDCPSDCEPYECGNTTCEPGEDPGSCGEDCGSTCGDCICEGGESYDNCPTDCGFCGDGYCINICGYIPEDESNCKPDCCVPDCTERECGDDGCGGSCGSCKPGIMCTFEGLCKGNCEPDCTDRVCGSDGCGGSCGECEEGLVCLADGKCTCVPDCANLDCGDDGCGGICGTCPETHECVENLCFCEPACEGKDCGNDGCGSVCGMCPSQHECQEDLCVCIPACDGKECGDDGCNETCGECPENHQCDADFSCLCLPDCAGKECGDNGCEGSCGSCAPGLSCEDGYCGSCATDCEGKTCGDDGCGGNCGTCSAQHICTLAGTCTCVPDCDGKQCGDDGCDGVCGECTANHCEGNVFVPSSNCMANKCVGDAPIACDDGNVCTTDTCDEVSGCAHASNVELCSDGDPCTEGDTCDGGICAPGAFDKDCDDGTDCTIDSCNPGTDCVHVPDDTACDDGEECTADACEEGAGCIHAPLDDGESCGDEGFGGICSDGTCQCTPTCVGKDCGSDGCGGTCGGCPTFHQCNDSFACICVPDCGEKVCGSDGCAGSCGSCGIDTCGAGQCIADGAECNDGNSVAWDGCTAGNISEFQVNTTVSGDQNNPALTGLDGGGAVMVWETVPQPGNGVIHARFLKANGLFADEQEVSTLAANSHCRPAVLRSSSNRVVITWQSLVGDSYSIWARRYDSAGVALDDEEFKVNTQDVADHSNPAGAFVSDGETGLGLVWDGRGPNDGQGIYLSHYDWPLDDSLTKVNGGADTLVNSLASGGQYRPAIAVASDGSFVIAWDRDPLVIHETVLARRFLANATAESEPVEVISNHDTPARFPAIAALGESGYVIVWESGSAEAPGSDGEESGIALRRLDVGGQTLAEEEAVVNTTTAGSQATPAVAGNSAGQYVVVWTAGSGDSSGSAVVMQRFDVGGPAGGEITVNLFELGDQAAPAVALSQTGAITVLFTATTDVADGADIFAAAFNWDGGRLLP